METITKDGKKYNLKPIKGKKVEVIMKDGKCYKLKPYKEKMIINWEAILYTIIGLVIFIQAVQGAFWIYVAHITRGNTGISQDICGTIVCVNSILFVLWVSLLIVMGESWNNGNDSLNDLKTWFVGWYVAISRGILLAILGWLLWQGFGWLFNEMFGII